MEVRFAFVRASRCWLFCPMTNGWKPLLYAMSCYLTVMYSRWRVNNLPFPVIYRCLAVIFNRCTFPYTYCSCLNLLLFFIGCAIFVCYIVYKNYLSHIVGFELLCPCGVGHKHTPSLWYVEDSCPFILIPVSGS